MMPRDAELGAAKQESSSSGAFERNISSSSSTWSRLKDPRIVRVSRATGGKDRHSKVCTVRGLRDRRVRLSVPTAIQLYDLQDRLGLNQPSKVVDWLLNAAKNEIEELPPLQIPITLLNPHFDNLKDEVTATTERNHHQSWPTTSHHQEDDREGIKHEYQFNNPSSSSSYPFINSFRRWDPSNLTLSHTPISIGLTAQHPHNLPNFSVQSQHQQQQQQQQQQVLVYQSGMMTAQSYFVPQMINAFDSKHPTNFHTWEVSASSSSLTTATPRPFSFNMATTADLLPSQTNAVDDDLHSS